LLKSNRVHTSDRMRRKDFRLSAMRTGVIIQARMSSERFPGKVLYEVRGKPLLEYLLERLEHCRYCDAIVVATSVEESDDDIKRFCDGRGVNCYRGSLENVAGRVNDAAVEYSFDGFVRICADSPLLDHRLVDRSIKIFTEGQFDLVTNVLERTFPKGQSVEVLDRGAFERSIKLMNEPLDREHVTRYFYSRQDEFKIFNLSNNIDYGWLQLAIDSPDDIELFGSILGVMDKPHWQYDLDGILKLWHQVCPSGQENLASKTVMLCRNTG